MEADDDYAYFELDTTGMKLRTLNFNDPHVLRSLRGTPVSTDNWPGAPIPRTRPALTLSATENLHTRLLGPVLSCGIRYRVVDNYNGVVAIEIERLGLPPMRGYCLAADLEAVEQGARPKRSGRQVDWIRSVSDRVSQTFGVIDITLSNAISPSGPAGHLPPLGESQLARLIAPTPILVDHNRPVADGPAMTQGRRGVVGPSPGRTAALTRPFGHPLPRHGRGYDESSRTLAHRNGRGWPVRAG